MEKQPKITTTDTKVTTEKPILRKDKGKTNITNYDPRCRTRDMGHEGHDEKNQFYKVHKGKTTINNHDPVITIRGRRTRRKRTNRNI
jgi:hypothetical protein